MRNASLCSQVWGERLLLAFSCKFEDCQRLAEAFAFSGLYFLKENTFCSWWWDFVCRTQPWCFES